MCWFSPSHFDLGFSQCWTSIGSTQFNNWYQCWDNINLCWVVTHSGGLESSVPVSITGIQNIILSSNQHLFILVKFLLLATDSYKKHVRKKKCQSLKLSYLDNRFQQVAKSIAGLLTIFYFPLWPIAKFG